MSSLDEYMLEDEFCLLCGEIARREVRVVTRTKDGVTIWLDQPGLWCNYCGEGIITSEDRAAATLNWRSNNGKT